jgi:hypothetical protein
VNENKRWMGMIGDGDIYYGDGNDHDETETYKTDVEISNEMGY